MPVKSYDEVIEIFKEGNKRLCIYQTHMSAASSRDSRIFTIEIEWLDSTLDIPQIKTSKY